MAEKFFKKLHKNLRNYCLFDNICFSMATKMSRYDPDLVGSVTNLPPGSASVNQDYEFADPDQ
jgi:hypothetical protein